MEKKTLLVAFGGASPEHEVSVITAHQAIAALEETGQFQIKPLYITKSGRWLTGSELLNLKNFEDLKKLESELTPCHFAQNEFGLSVLREEKAGFFSKAAETSVYAVLLGFHGSKGENGAFQGVCEMYNLPYTCCGVLGSAVGMDKVTAKSICRSNKIPVTEDVNFLEEDWVGNREKIIGRVNELGYPLIVKPVNLGSSIGVKIVKNRDEMSEAVETAFRYDRHILVEKVISPLMEINCSVLGSGKDLRTSVCERPLGKEELLSFQDKYLSDDAAKGMASADRVIPADIPEEFSAEIREISKKIFRILSCSGVARLDFLINAKTHEFYFNEINTIPGSFSFYLWKESGLEFDDLLLELIELAVQEHQKKSRRIQSYETNLLSKKAVKGIKGLKGTK